MAFALWITGLPASGKSTIASLLAKQTNAKILNLDDIRKEITPNPTYSKQEREIVYRSLAYLGSKLYEEGVNIIIDATDNRGIGRKKAKELISNLKIIQIKTPIYICKKREQERIHDCQNLYQKAEMGEIDLPGINEFYEEEKDPAIIIDTSQKKPDEAVNHILSII